MAWRKKRNTDITSKIDLDRLAQPEQISSYIKKIVNASQYDYNETEAFEVKTVILNKSINHGGVLGNFINTPDQEVLGGIVLPLSPHITNIPVIGEHVVVVEYNGQHYYTGIINRKNSPNENSIPGVTPGYEPNTKFGKTFERRDIRKVHVNEGDIVFEGRFGNTIKLGSNKKNQAPNIRIRAGQNSVSGSVGLPIKENINEDGSSIYLSTDETITLPILKAAGAPFPFPAHNINGNSIVMNSDRLFFNARKGNINLRASGDVTLQGREVFIHAGKKGTIKLGDPKALFIPTLNPEVINDLMFDIMMTIFDGFTAIGKATTPPGLVSAAKDIAQIVAQRVPNIVDIVSNEKYFNKEIMIALPGFSRSGKQSSSDTDSKTLVDGNESGVGADGKFDSENFERGSNRTADGQRDTGPRKY